MAVSENIIKIPKKLLLFMALAFQLCRHFPAALWLHTRRPDTLIGKFIKSRPEMRWMVLTPLVSANWNARKRIDVIKTHFSLVSAIGGILLVEPDSFSELVNLEGIMAGLHVTLDAPRWLLRDGLLSLSLWAGDKRIYMLSFCLGLQGAVTIAYVGGLQGVNLSDDGELYRNLTKQSHGIRPRDLLFDVFRSLCRSLHIAQILAISDAGRHHFSRYNRIWVGGDPVKGNYDEIWRDRGGEWRADGFFAIPTAAGRRAADDIPARKRAMYRSRYAMLDDIDTAVRESVAGPAMFTKHPNLGTTWRRNALAPAQGETEPCVPASYAPAIPATPGGGV